MDKKNYFIFLQREQAKGRWKKKSIRKDKKKKE